MTAFTSSFGIEVLDPSKLYQIQRSNSSLIGSPALTLADIQNISIVNQFSTVGSIGYADFYMKFSTDLVMSDTINLDFDAGLYFSHTNQSLSSCAKFINGV